MTPGRPKVVVVGNGMAGFRFVGELLARARGFDITVVGEEPGGAYNRAQLPSVLGGTASEQSIQLADPGWYAARGVRLVAGVAACRIERAGRRLHLTDGSVLRYDVLVLALGSTPVLPPAAGLAGRDGRLPPGVVAFRTLADCSEIQAYAAKSRGAVVVGGGVLGLETARALVLRGLPVTVVQRGPWLMDRQLDSGAARVLTRTLRSVGVRVRTGRAVQEVRGSDRVTGIVLDDGREIDADLLVMCCGSRPKTGLARAAGLAVGAGVVVDDQMRSSTDPAIFAVGDCAEHRGRTHGLVVAAWAQAAVAARAVARLGADDSSPLGDNESGYAPAPAVVRLKADGIELAALGSASDVGGAEVIRFTDPARGVYQKLIVRNGRLSGAVLLGDTRAAGTITQLFHRGATVPADRSSLLMVRRGGTGLGADRPDTLPGQAIVCHCNGVTKSAICSAWLEGASDARGIVERTRAATGCGTCRGTVDDLAAWLAAARPGLVHA